MTTILLDHNIEGYAVIILGSLAAEGWLDLLPIRLATFADVNLPFESDDRAVWRFAHENNMILLTDNRNMKGKDSLERAIREENTLTSLPVLTIGKAERLDEKNYRGKFIARLVEVILDLDNYLGTGRIFIP